jgi:uncharacterized protein (DUF885 family)
VITARCDEDGRMGEAVGVAVRAIQDAWEEARTGLYSAVSEERPVDRFADFSEEAALAASARAEAILERIATVDTSALPVDLATTLAVAQQSMRRQARAGRWYWTVFDPVGIGFWAMYAPTAYGGGWLLSHAGRVLGRASLATPADVDRYLGLVEDYARVVRQLDARTRGQAERGIHLPRVQLEQAIKLVEQLRTAAPGTLVRGDGDTKARIEERVATTVDPAFAAMQDWLTDPARLEHAGEEVGLAHLPDGPEIYAELVAQHLTLDVKVEEVHQYGLEALERIRKEMQVVADELGESDAQAVVRRLDADPAWHSTTVEGVTAVFQRYIDRLAPHVDNAFRFQPEAPYGVEALPASLSGSMTFGYYDKPGPGQPLGRYLFNGENLVRQQLATLATLTFHELVPGHHFHLASQVESTSLHPLRANACFNAFNEGWAEYAAHLAGEMGMYELPEERFGRLLMDAFLTTRLVVDTGMNALGWSLERAREFMRENAFISEAEVLSESVRYSCDIPAQALGYKMGQPFLVQQREKMRAALGDAFDIRDFHDVVLRPGGLPLSEVAANVDRAIAQRG